MHRSSIVPLLIFAAVTASAQYRPIELPKEWTFRSPTPAYSIDDPSKQLGDFQPGIQVEVRETEPTNPTWQVAFKRYGQPELLSRIPAPDLSQHNASGFERVRGSISEFPVLQKLLEAPAPWPENANEMADQIFAGSAEVVFGSETSPTKLSAEAPQPVWGTTPLESIIDYTNLENPTILIELWNKGDAFQSSVRPNQARQELLERLEALQDTFRTQVRDPAPANTITAVKVNEAVFLLPNDLRVSLRYDSGEYLLIQIQSISHLRALSPPEYDPAQFRSRIAAQVKTSEKGFRYISGIPMIDQGKKGYCAAATLARVLQFYGYPVDMHAMAELAETEAQATHYDRGGTLRENLIRAMRRICNSTPFKLREVKDTDPDSLRALTEKGVPMIWFVPGHARLLIGMHPEKNEIVFSDTWGPEYQYQTGDWDYFSNFHREMWTLLPD